MIVALETAIISGTGEGQPLGIAVDTDIPAAQVINVAAADMNKYDTWTGLIGKMPRKYRTGAAFILNDSDWNKYIVGMVDANGQPVARTTYGLDGAQQERFLGREVIPTEDYLPSIDDAETGDVIGIICKLSDYMFNSNMQMTFKRYFDENTDEWISKSTLIGDGKLADKNGVVLIKKA
jgi:HK97 family phage major capsid protein